jgi:hypothetical protein
MSDYLSHLTWCPNLDELTDWDLIDCLRGSMSVPFSSSFGADLLRERAQIVAEMDARNFPAEVVEAAITIGSFEAVRQMEKLRQGKCDDSEHVSTQGTLNTAEREVHYRG